MLRRILAFIDRERRYVWALTRDERWLLLSTFLYGLANPMMTTFANAYLWRQSQDPIVLGIFNIGYFGALGGGFLVNALLLRRFSPVTLHALGAILKGSVPVFLVALGAQASGLALLLGAILGFAGGFYWGNRNLITSAVTVGPTRFKYLSIEMALYTLSSVLAPLFIGWTIAFGASFEGTTVQTAYQGTAFLGFLLVVAAAFTGAAIKHRFPPLRGLFVRSPRASWNSLRAFEFFHGLLHGLEATFLLVLIFVFLPEEAAIGTLLSATALLAVLGTYFLGKRRKDIDHVLILSGWTAVTLVGKAVFALLFSLGGVIFLQITEGLTKTFRLTSESHILYGAIDAQIGKANTQRRYVYLVDRELILNFGRVTGIGLFLLIYKQAPETTLQYGILALLLPQLAMVFYAKRLKRQISGKPRSSPDIAISTPDATASSQ